MESFLMAPTPNLRCPTHLVVELVRLVVDEEMAEICSLHPTFFEVPRFLASTVVPTTSSNLAPTWVLFDHLAGSFWVLHRFLFLADDLDLDVEDDLHLLVGFDLFIGDLPKVHESLDRFLDDFLHAVAAFQGFYLSHVAELRHPHVNLEEHKNIT